MKTYQTIIADPPWDVGSMILDKWKSPLSDKYPTMKTRDICALRVKQYTDENCGLWLWTTHTFLEDALQVMKSWGFKYHILLTWDKGKGWTLFGFHRRTELVLWGYKGKINIKQNGQAIDTIQRIVPDLFFEKSTIHSRKPELFYKIVEHNSPPPRLELFARIKRNGWDVWGNEVESDIEL